MDRHFLVDKGLVVDAQQDWEMLKPLVGVAHWCVVTRALNSTDICFDRPVQPHSKILVGEVLPSGQLHYGPVTLASSELAAMAELPFMDLRTGWTVPKNGDEPSNPTVLKCTAFRVDKSFRLVRGFIPIIEAKSDLPIHHMHVHWCTNNAYFRFKEKNPEAPCVPPSFDPERDKTQCHSTIFTFTPGVEPMLFPEDAGIPIGEGPDELGYVILETHYDNFNFISGR